MSQKRLSFKSFCHLVFAPPLLSGEVLCVLFESRKHCDVIYNRWFWNTRCRILFYAPALSTWIITWDGHKYSRKFNFPSWRPMIYRWRYKRMDIIYCRHFVFPTTARYFERIKIPRVQRHVQTWKITRKGKWGDIY